MAQTKYSRQREAVKHYLRCVRTHPTANTIYEDLSHKYPNISLGTVYRNLNFLVEQGKVTRLHYEGESDRYDGNTEPHYHFLCRSCHQVFDLPMEPLNHIDTLASVNFDGEIEGHSVLFHGICRECSDNLSPKK